MLLVAMPLLLVAMPFATSSVLVSEKSTSHHCPEQWRLQSPETEVTRSLEAAGDA